MTKLRKQRRKKRFRYNVNRKRLRNKINSVGKISCKEIADQWEKHKSVITNLKEMGLSNDPNLAVKIVNYKKTKETPRAVVATNDNEWFVESELVEIRDEIPLSKKIVAQKLSEDAKAPRVKRFRLPGSVVEFVTYLIDTHGGDYKAMARDKKNIDQESWKQLRQKIKLFKSIPEQYSEYLRKRGIEDPVDESDISSDGEW